MTVFSIKANPRISFVLLWIEISASFILLNFLRAYVFNTSCEGEDNEMRLCWISVPEPCVTQETVEELHVACKLSQRGLSDTCDGDLSDN